MMVRLFLLSLLTAYLLHDCSAQILNIERKRLETYDSGRVWLGNVSVGFDLQQKQTRVATWQGMLNLAHITPKNKLMFVADYENVNGEGEDLIRSGYLHTRLNLNWQKKRTYELFTQVQFDQVRGINKRFLVGGTIRFQPLNYAHKHTTMAIAPGVMYEYEDWTFKKQDSITSIPKISSYIHLHTNFIKNIELNVIAYYQARFDFVHQPRVSMDIALNYKLNKYFAVGTQFSMLYDSAPVMPIDKWVYTWNNMITFAIDRYARKHKVTDR